MGGNDASLPELLRIDNADPSPCGRSREGGAVSPSRNGHLRDVAKSDEMSRALQRRNRKYGYDAPGGELDIDLDGPPEAESPKAPPKKDTKKTPSGSTEKIEAAKVVILRNPKTGKQDPWHLQSLLVSKFGAEAGIVCSRCFFWTGLSTRHKAGWFSQTREEMMQDTGITSHAKLQKARAVLRGDLERAGKRWPGLLHEERPADPRAPTLYRISMSKLADALGIDLPSHPRQGRKR